MNTKLTGEEIYRRYQWRYTKDDFHYCPRCGHGLTKQPLHIPDEEQLVCHHCEFILYLDPKLVVTGLVTHGDTVLLLRRAEEPQVGKWALPGGHVQRGENPRSALINEVRQETGIAITVDSLADVFTAERHGVVQLVFKCTAMSAEVRTNIESFEAQFFTAQQLPWEGLAFTETLSALSSIGYQPAKP